MLVLALLSYGLVVMQAVGARLTFFGESASATSKLQSAAFLMGAAIPGVAATVFAALLGGRGSLILIVIPSAILAGLGFAGWGPTFDTQSGQWVQPRTDMLFSSYLSWGLAAVIVVTGTVALIERRGDH
ncbi:hypothetical protein [Oryzihumus sp.]